MTNIVASELEDPICHSDECQIGSFSSEATIYTSYFMSGFGKVQLQMNKN